MKRYKKNSGLIYHGAVNKDDVLERLIISKRLDKINIRHRSSEAA